LASDNKPEAPATSKAPVVYDVEPVPPRLNPNVPEVICEVSIAIAVLVTADTRP
jgi:hypothetical protein